MIIDAQTRLYGIIGSPVRHSLSPIIHNGAFRRMGLNAVYLAFEVESLEEAMRGIRGLGIRGVSVTLPFKTQVLPFLDEIEATARKIKAVNTLVNQDGKLVGYNTDWQGAIEALEDKIDLMGKNILLLGAGGTARAIGFGLKEKGCHVFVSNRTPEKAEELAKDLDFVYQPLSSMDGRKIDIIIIATSVGMIPHHSEIPLHPNLLKEGMIVMDVVYQPLKTKLLQAAEEIGCRTIGGVEMLARQAAGQFAIWTGIKPEIEEIKRELEQVLGDEGMGST